MRNRDLPIGFTPVPNARICAAILAAANARIAAGQEPTQAEAAAIRDVARKLPPPPFARNTLRRPRPSKNDDPAYRKASCAR